MLMKTKVEVEEIKVKYGKDPNNSITHGMP